MMRRRGPGRFERLRARMPWNVEKDDLGAALVWLSLMLTFLIGAAAFAVDLGWLYVNSSRIQRTADAAALGGVTFMPSFPSTAQSTAVDIASANGYLNGTNATLGYPAPPEEYQFAVTVAADVDTFFLRVFGQDKVTMTRQATAEYVLPVPIGSPQNQFGYSPASGYWASISAPYLSRGNGDFFATRCIESSSNTSCDTSNPAWRSGAEAGYWYAIDLPTGSAGLDIDIYDAGFYDRDLTEGTGDFDYGLDGDVDMRYTLYEPDGTPLIHTDNTTASCNTGWAGSDGIWNVDPEDTSPNTMNSWFNFCTISTGSTTPGRYILRVESLGTGFAINQYAIRAYAGTGANPAVQGINDIGIFANIDASSSTFYFAEIEEVHAGKDLEMTIFDPGDADGDNFITILDPYGNVPTCSWVVTEEDGGVQETGSGSCVIDASDRTYNSDVVTLTISLAPSYTCNPSGPFGGCWWQVNYDYESQAHDRTTWQARIIGNPIHLVNN